MSQNNSHDCVHLQLHLTAADLKSINVERAAPIMQKLRLSVSKPSSLSVCLKYPIAPMVWAFLAVKTNTFEQLHKMDRLGVANTIGAEALARLLQERLARYDSFARSK
jgi:hypothetical protein